MGLSLGVFYFVVLYFITMLFNALWNRQKKKKKKKKKYKLAGANVCFFFARR